MARCQVKMPDDFALKLSKIEHNISGITEKVVEAGGKVALEITRDELDSAIGGTKFESRSTGELQSALGVSPVSVSKKGMVNVKIGFNEPRRRQYRAKNKRSYNELTNAMIANVIEYGKSGQPAKPFMARAKKKALRLCKKAMAETFDKEVNKL